VLLALNTDLLAVGTKKKQIDSAFRPLVQAKVLTLETLFPPLCGENFCDVFLEPLYTNGVCNVVIRLGRSWSSSRRSSRWQ
jgi:hypothetical protein